MVNFSRWDPSSYILAYDTGIVLPEYMIFKSIGHNLNA